MFHSIGFQTGTDWRSTGSIWPNRIAQTTYSGAMKNTRSQRMPGAASSGQSSRHPPGPRRL